MAGRAGKTVEQIYKKMSQLEHVLQRPDSYVGSVDMQLDRMWVWDPEKNQMVFRQVAYVPALYKIFDEILVNAADNLIRDPTMDQIKIDIDQEHGCIKVWNNGHGIPIELHKEHNIYVPELVFGHLLTSDNYDDNEKKVTGGRNGYGAKLTNIFSTKFVVKTADSRKKKSYKQTFTKNMTQKEEPAIESYDGTDFTEVKFYPDLARFKMTKLDDDIVALMTKRAYDIAGTSNGGKDKKCKVWLNGKRLQINNFKEYADLYLTTPEGQKEIPRVHEKCGDRWEIVVSLSDMSDGQFQQVSFVNAISTSKGGTHVNHVADQICDVILKKVQAKNKGGMEVKNFHIKNHLWIFVNCLIENPAFVSQTKEVLSTSVSQFGSKCIISEATMNKIGKSGIVEQVLEWAKFKQQTTLQNKLKAGTGNSQRVHGIPKLEDANDAGSRNSDKCTLILTEGDSAKALAVAGLGVVGRDHFGVFPLRGKLLNVRDATFKQTIENKEIQALLKIVGLDPKKQYDSVKGLRYGSIMIMTDQDHDGSHIKGLFLNMIHNWWPSLCKLPGFIKEFVTPIVKCTKGNRLVQFFTMTEYENWKRENNNGKGWQMKYYKGLGTNTSQEAKEYFSQIDKHKISFRWVDERDGEKIDMAFNKARADDRKEWINNVEDGVCVDHSIKSLRYSDFVDKELVHFSKYDVMRSIPSMVDGFKPAQRKVLFCCFKRNLVNDIKVAQFIGYVSEQSAYHHGEQSLESTIIGMAQNFVGSNNINLLVPSGQFGTRLQGGKDAASARYIYTRLCPWTREIFNPQDDALLEYQNEEGQSIEPLWYCPVIPMVLVNGAEGIGTGWSTSVPCYNPRDIIQAYRDFLRGQPLRNIDPWYWGFNGKLENLANAGSPGSYEMVGKIEVIDDKTIDITELPVHTWTQSYKEFLHEMLPGAEKAKDPKDKKKEETAKQKASAITLVDIKEYHTENTVSFRLILTPEKLEQAVQQGLEKVFKLRSKFSTTNMILFDRRGKIRKYESPLEIMEEFTCLRLEMYERRKAHVIAVLQKDIAVLNAKVDFILAVLSGQIVFNNKKIAELIADLRVKGFKPINELTGEDEDALMADRPGTPEDSGSTSKGYDYLLGQPLWSLTLDKVEGLKKLLNDKSSELEKIKSTSVEEMWDLDLARILHAMDGKDLQAAADRKNEQLIAEKSNQKSNLKSMLMSSSKPSVEPEKKKLPDFDPKTYLLSAPVIQVERKEFEYKQQIWKKEKEAVVKTKSSHNPSRSPSPDPDDDSLAAKIKRELRMKEAQKAEAPGDEYWDDYLASIGITSEAGKNPVVSSKPPKLPTNGSNTPSGDVDMEILDEDDEPLRRPSRAAAARAREIMEDSELSFMESDDDSDSGKKKTKKRPNVSSPKVVAPKKQAVAKQAVAKPKPKPKPKPKKKRVDSDDEDMDSFIDSEEEASDDSKEEPSETDYSDSSVEKPKKKKQKKFAISDDDD